MSCATCLTFDMSKIVKSDRSRVPSWLKEQNYVDIFIQNTQLKAYKNKCECLNRHKFKVDVGKKNAGKLVLYWGAQNQDSNNNILIKNAKNAYDNFTNSGVSKVNNDGVIDIEICCPQNYRTLAQGELFEKTYFKHFHFVISNDSLTKWLRQLYTKIILCKIDYQRLKNMSKNGLYLILNTLPSEYYGREHIPNSYNLFYKTINKMSVEEVKEWVSYVVENNYPKLHNLIKSRQISLYEIPIVTYCAHDRCNASELAAEQLMKKGFVNISEYPGGMEDYKKQKN